ncbi:MAG: RidA family protein [Halobacteriota archaeon]
MPEAVHTDEAPSFESFDLPISQAIIHGDTVYVAGQTGVDPATGEPVEDDLEAEARQALENIAAILEAAGTSFDNVVKATVFIEDMADFDRVNAVYREFVSEPYPARSAVEVSDLALEFAMEIEVIAAVEP